MTTTVGINGFGRIGRLALKAAWDWPDFDIVHINEMAGDADAAAHLLKYDSQHGTWGPLVNVEGGKIVIDNVGVSYSQNHAIEETDWVGLGCDIVVECTGKFKSKEALAPYLKQGVKKVVVSAPVKDGTLNIVVGVNHSLYDELQPDIVTAASCTTNCIAPIVKVMHEQLGIKHGCITTIHDITNTQSILDQYHKDLRRARACGLSMIPTSTGSATAITEIFPDLKGKLNGIAVRVPLANASLTDCVFEVERATSVAEVNQLLRTAARAELKGILGYEDVPLVSVDYNNDTRSSIIDAPSTTVIDETQVKILSWYDNEIGYVNRMMELVKQVCRSL